MIAGKKNGAIVERFLGDMLEVDDRKRLSFNELEAKIPSLLVSRIVGEGKINLSLARANSVYLRNDPRSIRESTSRSKDSGRMISSSRGRGTFNRDSVNRNTSNK